MKKTLLFLTFTVSVFFTNAQCNPDPQFTVAGIYPDSTSGLSPAYVGQPYSQNITIITPNDTSVEFAGQVISVTVDNIDLTNVTGLPATFSYSCDPPNCSFFGGTIACAELYSAGPTSSEIGSHQIIFETTAFVSDVPLIGTTTQDDVIDYYYLNITSASSTINQFNDFSFELKDVFPNPVNNYAKIQFISGISNDIFFTVFNHLGEKIEERNIAAIRGVNDIKISTNDYANGMYLYSINNGVQILSKRMIVAN